MDRIRDTTESHGRCAIIEVMGNHCGDVALFGGLAEGADLIITPDHPIPEDEIFHTLKQIHDADENRRAIVIVSEKLYPDLKEFAKRVQEATGFDTRSDVLGHVQRGGAPSAFDRILAARMGAYAVDCLCEGKGGSLASPSSFAQIPKALANPDAVLFDNSACNVTDFSESLKIDDVITPSLVVSLNVVKFFNVSSVAFA